jgi:predicted enzyme related to lactoylglutathione lyase
LPKSESTFTESAKNHRLPPSLNHADCGIKRTPLAFGVTCTLFSQRLASNRTGYLKVPSCKSGGTDLHCDPLMAIARLFRVILPVSSIEGAAAFYSAVLEQPGMRISPGRHYFDCCGTILACFDPRADGDPWDATPNPDHSYFAVEDLEGYQRRVSEQPSAKILRTIETQPWGERSFYCSDPFGNKLCFVDQGTLYTGR